MFAHEFVCVRLCVLDIYFFDKVHLNDALQGVNVCVHVFLYCACAHTRVLVSVCV